MKFVKYVFAFAAAMAAAPLWAQSSGNWLVTPDEVLRFQGGVGFDDPLPLRARAIVPTIEIMPPQAVDQQLHAPFPITLKFVASDAPIVPSSFKVLYGALRIDITDRIAKYAHATAEGFSFEKAQVPPGKHRLAVQVADEKQRLAERELRIEVE